MSKRRHQTDRSCQFSCLGLQLSIWQPEWTVCNRDGSAFDFYRPHPDRTGSFASRNLEGEVLVTQSNLNLAYGSKKQVRLAAVLTLAFVLLLAGCAKPAAVVPPQATATAVPPPAELPAPGTALPEPTASPSVETQASKTPVTLTTPPVAGPPVTGEANRIVIPKISLDAPMVDVGWKVVERGNQRITEWETADNAAGRLINSAKPGEQGNVVLSGHHNTKGEVFRAISDGKLAVGDFIYLYDGQGNRVTYVVNEVTKPLLEVGASEEQRLANARYIQPTNDARVTLVTCWPYYTNTHRVIVVGQLVE